MHYIICERCSVPTFQFGEDAIMQRCSLTLHSHRVLFCQLGPVARIPGLHRPLGKLHETGMSGMDLPAVGKTIAEDTKVMAEVEWESSSLQYQASRALPVGQRSARSDGIRPVLEL